MWQSADSQCSRYRCQRKRETEKGGKKKNERAHRAVSVSVWLCPETRGWGDSANPERLLNSSSVSSSLLSSQANSPSFFLLSPSLTFIIPSLSLPSFSLCFSSSSLFFWQTYNFRCVFFFRTAGLQTARRSRTPPAHYMRRKVHLNDNVEELQSCRNSWTTAPNKLVEYRLIESRLHLIQTPACRPVSDACGVRNTTILSSWELCYLTCSGNENVFLPLILTPQTHFAATHQPFRVNY